MLNFLSIGSGLVLKVLIDVEPVVLGRLGEEKRLMF